MRNKMLGLIFTVFMLVLAVPGFAWAAEAPAIDTGDTSFLIICTALVLLMTPGLALFYGGMVRKKNVLNTTMHSFISIAIVSVQWVLIGYTIAFGPDLFKGLLGNLDFMGLNGMGGVVSGTIPAYVFAAFQLMFAIITVALISGSIAERMKFGAWIIFVVLWTTLIYDPLAHWVWSADGWLFNLPALDFAGGTVVHISSGVSALIAALMLGKRKGYGKVPMLPHNIPMTLLGAGLLWFGWFGFNAGSALTAGDLASLAFITTNTAAATAALAWMFAEWMHHGKPTALGAASGAIAGLVAITPAAGFVTPLSAIIIGLVGGCLCYFSVAIMKAKLGYDDALDAFGCHGVGGTWGAIATGLFATKAVNAAGQDGLFYGNPGQLVNQLIAVGATYVLAIVGTFVILKAISLFTSLRVSADEEEVGLDISLHGEDGYRDMVVGGFAGVYGENPSMVTSYSSGEAKA